MCVYQNVFLYEKGRKSEVAGRIHIKLSVIITTSVYPVPKFGNSM